MKARYLATAAVALALTPTLTFAAIGDVLFSDDFDGGTSAANYTTVGDPDDNATGTRAPGGVRDEFDAAFSYTDLGQASDVRSGTGARFLTDNALTAFVSGVNLGSAPVKISYDLFADPNSGGSTEYAFVGVGNGTLPFQNYLRGSLQGTEETQGVFAGGLTDSDTSGASDYVILEGNGAVGEPSELFNADAAGAAQNGVGFSNILPPGDSGPSGQVIRQAVLQHRWVAVDLIIDGADVTYLYDGQLVATVTASAPVTGLAGFGIGDPFPSVNQGSLLLGGSPDTMVLIDNIVITEIPEPATLAMAGLTLMGLGFTRRR